MKKVAVVVGGSRGIGACVAKRLGAMGYAVVVSAKTEKEDPKLPGTIHTVVAEIKAAGGQALAVRCDVRKLADMEALVDATIKEYGRVDVVFFAAGALFWKSVEQTNMSRYDLVMDINARAPYALARAFLPHLKRSGAAHFICSSPPIDMRMAKGKVAYTMSKFGATILAHGLGEELRGTGVAINAIWPATMIRSQATINYGIGNPKLWRKEEIIADAIAVMINQDPKTFTARALIDEQVLRDIAGVTDFRKYRCDPDHEPPSIAEVPSSGFGGSTRSKL